MQTTLSRVRSPARMVLALVVASIITATLPGRTNHRALGSVASKQGYGHTAVSRVREARAQSNENRALAFEANGSNEGEWIKFSARGAGYELFLTPVEAVLVSRSGDNSQGGVGGKTSGAKLTPRLASFARAVLRVKLNGSNRRPRIEGINELQGDGLNYRASSYSAATGKETRTFTRIQYHEVYPGIGLIYYGSQRELRYDFVIGPGADHEDIGLSFESAEKVSLDGRGNLVVRMQNGWEIRQAPPIAYQRLGGERREVPIRYVLHNGRKVTLRMGGYDRAAQLVISLTLTYENLAPPRQTRTWHP